MCVDEEKRANSDVQLAGCNAHNVPHIQSDLLALIFLTRRLFFNAGSLPWSNRHSENVWVLALLQVHPEMIHLLPKRNRN